MAKYQIQTDQGTFEIEADREPTQQEALQAISGHLKSPDASKQGESPSSLGSDLYNKTKEELYKSLPLVGSSDQYNEGMKNGKQLVGDNILGKLIGNNLGLMRSAPTLFNPLFHGAGELISLAPKAAQAAGSEAGGDETAALRDLLGKNQIQSAASIPNINSGIPLLDVPVNTTINNANEIVKQPLYLAGLTPKAIGEQVSAVRSGFEAANNLPATVSDLISNAGSKIGDISPSIAEKLRASAEKDVSQALSPTTKNLKGITERITPDILSRPMMDTYALTKEGLEAKASARREAAGEALEAHGELKGLQDPQKIVDDLEDLKKPYTVGGKVVDQGAIDRIQKVQDVFSQYGDSIASEDLRDIRRIFDKDVAAARGFGTPLEDKSVANIKKVAANSIRKVLSDSDPDLAKLNSQFSFFANLDDVISATNERVKPQTGALNKMAGVALAAGGHGVAGMAIRFLSGKAIMEAVRSPGWKLLSARVKNNIANMIVNDPKEVPSQLSDVKGFDPKPFEDQVKALTDRAVMQRRADFIKNTELKNQLFNQASGKMTAEPENTPEQLPNPDMKLSDEDLLNQSLKTHFLKKASDQMIDQGGINQLLLEQYIKNLGLD